MLQKADSQDMLGWHTYWVGARGPRRARVESAWPKGQADRLGPSEFERLVTAGLGCEAGVKVFALLRNSGRAGRASAWVLRLPRLHLRHREDSNKIRMHKEPRELGTDMILGRSPLGTTRTESDRSLGGEGCLEWTTRRR